MVLHEDVETLNSLGLTMLQARIYLAIAILEKATIKTISKTANIARQEIYRVTSELQEKGLIEKIITTPVEYIAIPVHDAINILLQLKNQENLAVQQKAVELLHRNEEVGLVAQPNEGNRQFILIPKKEAPRRKFNDAIHKGAVSVDGIYYWEGFREAILDGTVKWKENTERGMKVRLIVYKPQAEKAVAKNIQIFKKKGSFNIRYTSNPPPATITIFNKEEILVTTSPNPKPLETASIWIKNQGFVAVFQDYFDRVWETSETTYPPSNEHRTDQTSPTA
jgi:hypothetical protein